MPPPPLQQSPRTLRTSTPETPFVALSFRAAPSAKLKENITGVTSQTGPRPGSRVHSSRSRARGDAEELVNGTPFVREPRRILITADKKPTEDDAILEIRY